MSVVFAYLSLGFTLCVALPFCVFRLMDICLAGYQR